MITINLLPPELRKRERTPIVIFLPIVIGLVCVLSAGAVACYVHFAWLNEVVNDRTRVETELRQKKARLRYEEALLAEEQLYKQRSDTITGIASSRVLMTKKLDQLCQVIAEGAETSSYLIWATDLKTTPPKAQTRRGAAQKGPRPGGAMQLKGYALAQADPLFDFNRFHAALKDSDMFNEFIELTNPQGSVKYFNDERVPSKGWTVDLEMQMKHPEDVAKEQLRNSAIAERPGNGKRPKTR